MWEKVHSDEDMKAAEEKLLENAKSMKDAIEELNLSPANPNIVTLPRPWAKTASEVSKNADSAK